MGRKRDLDSVMQAREHSGLCDRDKGQNTFAIPGIWVIDIVDIFNI